ncbi:hypothetical protein [Methylobacterium sp. XJLW]|uniref:hypothetical protein n=1 Tax=Methylobacterium sp. XJLW TaxID=739141 RepID=UPI000F55463A|nr:hypothetical protein [Methylobacterium sp. XJLW]
MRAAAAFVVLLAASPAAAACRPVPQGMDAISLIAGPEAVVRVLPASVAPGIAEWLTDAQVPGQEGADGYVAAVTATGIVLFPSRRGVLCDGKAGLVSVEETPRFLAWLRAWMDARGIQKDRSA